MNEVYEKSIRHFLKPIESLLQETDVSEIMVNGSQYVYAERKGVITKEDACFPDDAALTAAIRNIAEYAGRHLGGQQFDLDARLPTGERVHAIFPPCSRIGPCLTIRKFKQEDYGIADLIRWQSLSPLAGEFLQLSTQMHKNIVVAGGTGTGKTTFLNAISSAISESERIVVIEDSSELKLHQPHTVYLEAQGANENGEEAVTIRDLFVASLRMRPDRIVVGEVRRGEALDLIQSMISGHSGSLSTVHANSPRDAAIRLETLCLQSDVGLPQSVARIQVASALDLVVQLVRVDGKRYVESISECVGLDAGNSYVWNELFKYDASSNHGEGELLFTGRQPNYVDELNKYRLHDHVRLTGDVWRETSSQSVL